MRRAGKEEIGLRSRLGVFGPGWSACIGWRVNWVGALYLKPRASCAALDFHGAGFFPPGTHGKGQGLCPMHEMSLRFATLLQSLLRGAWVRPLKPPLPTLFVISLNHTLPLLFLYRCQLDKSNPTTVELGAVALEYGPRCQLFFLHLFF